MKTHTTTTIGLILGLSLSLSAALVPANAQQASNNQSSNRSSSSTGSSNGSDPTGGVILCASKSCMLQQAASSPNYPPKHPPLVIESKEGCSLEWRYIRLSNGMVREIRECERPIRPVHYR
ncbi:hypothetical protein [Roseibium litorale]|uniref:Uncharacterized protein n=1 Tax=Roseibium litorale TaxID=2803841 RepID=A0ABR9CQD2_9HYPH|nr:hypothetical protein [Roseibium litorale]MBD8893063.1 hypothetical protein [Roseibium litorale]